MVYGVVVKTERVMNTKTLAFTLLLSLSLILAHTAAFGVEHPDGSFATPDDGDSEFISFKHIDNTNPDDYPYGVFLNNLDGCAVFTDTYCSTNCGGVAQWGTATLTSVPTSDIAVTALVFNTAGTDLVDATSRFCAVLDGAGNVWAIDRDLPALPNITTANSSVRVHPCDDSGVFSPETGCLPPLPRFEISINHGFIKLDTTSVAPNDYYCSQPAHYGRMVVDAASDTLYICTASGWTTTSLTPVP